jgi:glycosyltransferase involved in cell wall biosynthesis
VPREEVARRVALVSSHPMSSGVGVYDSNLMGLGLYSKGFWFHFDRARVELSTRDPRTVVPSPPLWGRVSYALSLIGVPRWDRLVREYDQIHVTSPEFFHLSRRRHGVIGTVHDSYTFDSEFAGGFSASYRASLMQNLKSMSTLDGVIAVSGVTREKIKAHFPNVDPVVIHNWTGPKFRRRDMQAARSRLGLPQDKFIILNVSSAAPNKNLSLLESIARALPREFMIVHLGGGRLGNVAGPQVLDRRDYVSADDLPYFYNAANIYVATSTEEGFSFPVIESINSSLPVLAPRIDVFREVLFDSPYLVSSLHPPEWVELLHKLHEPAELARAAEWYADAIGKHYQQDRGLREMVHFLEEVSRPKRDFARAPAN